MVDPDCFKRPTDACFCFITFCERNNRYFLKLSDNGRENIVHQREQCRCARKYEHKSGGIHKNVAYFFKVYPAFCQYITFVEEYSNWTVYCFLYAVEIEFEASIG